MVWYKQRHPQKAGHIRRHVGIALSREDWALFEAEASETNDSLAHNLSVILASLAEIRRRMAVERELRRNGWNIVGRSADTDPGAST